MKKIGIIGYGTLGHQIEFFLREQNKPGIEFYYFDDQFQLTGNSNSFRFFDYRDFITSNLDFYICLGYKQLNIKSKILDELQGYNCLVPSLVHPTSYISPLAKIGNCVYIFPMCNIGQDVIIKNGVLLHNSVTISHNSTVNDCSFLAPSVTVAGNVEIGRFTFIGAGSVVSNNVKIGSNVKIGIGSVVTHNIAENISCIGNPVKIVNNLKLL